jgi:predicted Zn-dependent peptidase
MCAVFGNENPLGRNTSLSDYQNLKLSDIKEFYASFYALSNCEIIISGKVEQSTINSLNTYFGKEGMGNSTPNIEVDFKPTKQQKLFIKKDNALQSAIRIGRKLPNKLHPDYFGLQILNTVFGGYFGSRLMKNIREDKGYTYGIGSGVSSFLDGGYFFISTDVGSDVAKDALKEIYKEIELIRTEEIPLEELQLVKNYLLGKLLKSCDGPFNMAELFENVYFYGLDYDFYNNYIKTIKEITPKTLIALGVKYFNPADLTEVVVGKL